MKRMAKHLFVNTCRIANRGSGKSNTVYNKHLAIEGMNIAPQTKTAVPNYLTNYCTLILQQITATDYISITVG